MSSKFRAAFKDKQIPVTLVAGISHVLKVYLIKRVFKQEVNAMDLHIPLDILIAYTAVHQYLNKKSEAGY